MSGINKYGLGLPNEIIQALDRDLGNENDDSVKVVAVNTNIYLDPVNGSDSNDGIVGRPVKSFEKAVSLLPSLWSKSCTLHIAAGTVQLTEDSTKWVLGHSHGMDNVSPLIIQGEMTALLDGEIDDFTDNIVTAVDTGMTVDAYRGKFIRFTSGVAEDSSYLIQHNDSDTFTLASSFVYPAPSAADTFVIEEPASIIEFVDAFTLCGSGASPCAFNGVDVIFDAIKIQGTGGFPILRVEGETYVGMSQCWLDLGGGLLAVTDQSTLEGAGMGEYFSSDPAGFSAGLCLTNTPNVSVLNGSSLFGFHVWTDGSGFGFASIGSDALWITGCFSVDGYNIILSETTFFDFGPSEILNAPAGAAGITFGKGSKGDQFRNCKISDCSENAIDVDSLSLLNISSITGSGNGGVGLNISGMSYIRSGGNSVTGDGGDVVVDGDEAISWATADAGVNGDSNSRVES